MLVRNRAFLPIYRLKIPGPWFTLFFRLPCSGEAGDLGVANHARVLDFELGTSEPRSRFRSAWAASLPCAGLVSLAAGRVASLWPDFTIPVGWP